MPRTPPDPAQRPQPWLQVSAGTLGGRYLRRFWHPACRSVDLAPRRALRSRLLGETVTLYRGESGHVHCVAERCAHRGTLLSLGAVEGEDLRCHHHGWCFDGRGQCTRIPGEPDASAAQIRIGAHPAHEALGMVFVYLGPEPVPPAPRFAAFEGPGPLRLPAPEVWPCNYFERLQNSHDVMHVAFTHLRSGVSALMAGVPRATAEETEFGMQTRMYVPGQSEPLPPVLLYMPNVLQFQTPVDTQIGWLDHLVFRVPIDDGLCASYALARLPEGSRDAEQRSFDQPASYPLQPSSNARLGDRVLAGEVHLEDVDTAHLTELEDYLALAGLPPHDHTFDERLVAADDHLRVLRALFERELRALDAGRSLTAWSHLRG